MEIVSVPGKNISKAAFLEDVTGRYLSRVKPAHLTAGRLHLVTAYGARGTLSLPKSDLL